MTTGQGGAPAGWYADPTNPQQQRYFDGTQWTEHVHGEPAAGSGYAAEPGYAADTGFAGEPASLGTMDVTSSPAGAEPGRRSPLMALLVVGALAVGFGGGYLVGQSGEDEPAAAGVTANQSPAAPKVDEAQRTRERLAAVRSQLKNAATAQESYFTDNDTYTKLVSDLQKEGLNDVPGVKVTVVSASATAYCMSAVHTEAPSQVWYITTPPPNSTSFTSEPTLRPCT